MINQSKRLENRFQEIFGVFAAQEIAGNFFSEFPMNLWEKMGHQGLLGLGITEEWGGSGGNTLDILAATEAFTRKGHNFGMAFSLLIHSIVSRIVMAGHAGPDQKKKYLPELAAGKITASLAISEPDRGNHPKNLKTEAVYRDGWWYITGEKMYLSNGPFADIFIVLAVSGMAGDRKEYTAFIVPADTPGLSRTEPLALKVFRPSPHCGIKLDSCKIPESNILGDKGKAYSSIAIPFRDAEDILIMGPVLGGMARQMDIIIDAIIHEKKHLTSELKAESGWIQSYFYSIKTLACDAAVMMDTDQQSEELTYLLLTLKSMAGQHLDKVEKFFADTGLVQTPEWKTLMADLRFALRLAENVHRLRAEKLGNLITGKR